MRGVSAATCSAVQYLRGEPPCFSWTRSAGSGTSPRAHQRAKVARLTPASSSKSAALYSVFGTSQSTSKPLTCASASAAARSRGSRPARSTAAFEVLAPSSGPAPVAGGPGGAAAFRGGPVSLAPGASPLILSALSSGGPSLPEMVISPRLSRCVTAPTPPGRASAHLRKNAVIVIGPGAGATHPP